MNIEIFCYTTNMKKEPYFLLATEKPKKPKKFTACKNAVKITNLLRCIDNSTF
jgi:hypothetical protein